jgi:hypothetical protein
VSNPVDDIRRLGGVEKITPKAPKGKEGFVEINTKHSPAVRKQLKQLAMDLDRSQQDLVAEALNMLFVKYSRPPIA